MTRPEIVFVLARATNGGIGLNGALPWRIPADLRHFKRLTLGAPMLMGRRTFDSLPGLLPDRRHLVLTRDPRWSAAGAEPVTSVDAAIALAGEERLSVVGGAEIYAAMLPHADRIELTEIHAEPQADTFVPDFSPMHWQEVAREEHAPEGDRPGFAFVTLTRR